MSAIIFEMRFFWYEIYCFFPEMRKVVFLDFEFFMFFLSIINLRINLHLHFPLIICSIFAPH